MSQVLETRPPYSGEVRLLAGEEFVEFRTPNSDGEIRLAEGESIIGTTGMRYGTSSRPFFAGRNASADGRYIVRARTQVVFEVRGEPTYQIAFSDKPLLELTRDEARRVFRELEELV